MKITAVVVTYNRLELLKHGIECLRKQRQLSEIIIVNNGSTAGTTEWLKGIGGMASQVSTASKEPNIDVINQENVGGSGGFYTGIKAAFDDGADWIWCMDDDVFPREDCLDNLPENLQDSERYQKMDSAVDNLESAVDSIDEAKERISAASE